MYFTFRSHSSFISKSDLGVNTAEMSWLMFSSTFENVVIQQTPNVSKKCCVQDDGGKTEQNLLRKAEFYTTFMSIV